MSCIMTCYLPQAQHASLKLSLLRSCEIMRRRASRVASQQGDAVPSLIGLNFESFGWIAFLAWSLLAYRFNSHTYKSKHGYKFPRNFVSLTHIQLFTEMQILLTQGIGFPLKHWQILFSPDWWISDFTPYFEFYYMIYLLQLNTVFRMIPNGYYSWRIPLQDSSITRAPVTSYLQINPNSHTYLEEHNISMHIIEFQITLMQNLRNFQVWRTPPSFGMF